MWRDIIWNQLSTRVSLATPRMVCARVKESFLSHAELAIPSMSLLQADELRSCRGSDAQWSDFKWSAARATLYLALLEHPSGSL